SDGVASVFQRTFENKNTIITGFPRNDVFFDESLCTVDYKKIFDFESYKKIILYAPTFRDNEDCLSPFSSDLNHYNKKLGEENYLLLVKKHPWQKNFTIPEGLSHILDISNVVDDIQELLPWGDVLVTDYSSTFFDFMLTGNPVIFYPYDLEAY